MRGDDESIDHVLFSMLMQIFRAPTEARLGGATYGTICPIPNRVGSLSPPVSKRAIDKLSKQFKSLLRVHLQKAGLDLHMNKSS